MVVALRGCGRYNHSRVVLFLRGTQSMCCSPFYVMDIGVWCYSTTSPKSINTNVRTHRPLPWSSDDLKHRAPKIKYYINENLCQWMNDWNSTHVKALKASVNLWNIIRLGFVLDIQVSLPAKQFPKRGLYWCGPVVTRSCLCKQCKSIYTILV